MVPEFAIPKDLNVFLGQFIVPHAAIDALPKFVRRDPEQTQADRDRVAALPPTEHLLTRAGVSAPGLAYVLQNIVGLRLCDVYVQARTGKDPETSEERKYALVTYTWGRKPNDDKKRQKELDAGEALTEFKRLLTDRRWSHCNVFRLNAIKDSPALSCVFSGEGDPLDKAKSKTMPDDVAMTYAIVVTRAVEAKPTE